jgi:predicted peptidase
MLKIAVLAVGMLLGGVLTGECTAAEAPRQIPKHMQRTMQKTVELQYLLYLPDGYETDERHWPLLLFLHGAGSRGTELDSVKIDGPPRMIEEGHRFPFLVVSPQCPAEEWWTADVLVALLDEVVETYRIDENRVYVTGLSMGGFGTWRLAAAIPNRLAAIVPICGGGDPKTAEAIKGIPTWVFHGAKDQVVALAKSTEMVSALYRAGSDVRFTVYPEGDHVDAWREAYADETLWKWLIAQQRQPGIKD